MDGVVALGPDGGEAVVVRAERHHRILGEFEQFEIVELRFAPDFEDVGAHSHEDFVDSFYVLSGSVEFQVGEEAVIAGPGSFVAAPPGVTHGFRNVGGSELRMLNIHAPWAGFAERLRRA